MHLIAGKHPCQTAFLLKENGTIFCKPLTEIINNGISSSGFDGGLKLAVLRPIHKENETTSKGNYRNISLLPVVSKLFENLFSVGIAKVTVRNMPFYQCLKSG